jgi:phosphatidylserine/phosphatidylglycerophosphate/cardiolipin synthase-like enzyme
VRTNERFGRAQRSVDRRPSLEVSIRVAEEAAERPPSQSHNRLLSHDAAEAFETARSFASFYVWPGEQRTGGDRRGALHAKTVLADGSTAFVTSANLTGHGLGDNMELGLLVRGGHLPVRLTAHFDELVAHDVLRRVSAG